MRADENAGPRYSRVHAHAHTGVQVPQWGKRQHNTNTHPLTLTSISGHRTKLTSSKSSLVESICSTANICRAHALHHHSRRAWVRARESTPTVSAPTHLIKARYAKESIRSHHFPHGVTPLDDVVAGATFDDGKLILCSHALQAEVEVTHSRVVESGCGSLHAPLPLCKDKNGAHQKCAREARPLPCSSLLSLCRLQ
jgi:hypothetical protein